MGVFRLTLYTPDQLTGRVLNSFLSEYNNNNHTMTSVKLEHCLHIRLSIL